MKPLLILVDIQNDFLERSGLLPRADIFIKNAEYLLTEYRKLNLPVIHIHTEIKADGSNRMPHWKLNNIWSCLEGSKGVLSPEKLQPINGEIRLTKQFFSAFGNPELTKILEQNNIDTLIIAGLYLHGCIRATVMDGYERGFKMIIVDDVVGSTEVEHAQITRQYLDRRAGIFLNTNQLLLSLKQTKDIKNNQDLININYSQDTCFTETEINLEIKKAFNAQQKWRNSLIKERINLLNNWAEKLSQNQEKLAHLLKVEIGKTILDSNIEIERAIDLIKVTAELLKSPNSQEIIEIILENPPISVRYCPQGVIACITPFNNPVATPVGKIAPAIAYGNSVIWKPALEAPQTAQFLLELLLETQIDQDLVKIIFGYAETVRNIVNHPLISAVSFTGSTGVGKTLANQCLLLGKSFQGELGGNNAAIVLSDCKLEENIIKEMIDSAFSFAGQRCTRIQRFMVEESIFDEFIDKFVNALTPSLSPTGGGNIDVNKIAPVISETQLQWVNFLIEETIKEGGKLLTDNTSLLGFSPQQLNALKCNNKPYLLPTVITNINPQSKIAQSEIFAPVALIFKVKNLTEGIELANNVKHGLVATLYTQDNHKKQQFIKDIQAGIVNFNPGSVKINSYAPFMGWKNSGIGYPEHGIYDRQFYAKIQTIYGFNHYST